MYKYIPFWSIEYIYLYDNWIKLTETKDWIIILGEGGFLNSFLRSTSYTHIQVYHSIVHMREITGVLRVQSEEW